MNLHDVASFLSEAASSEPLLIYVAIGCALGGYPPGAHPPQQYPPYLRTFARRQICVLIDPHLEMPPRAHEDIQGVERDVTILPVLERFEHSPKEVNSTWFLHDLARLCTEHQHFLIVQEFTGTPLNEHYPFHLGPAALEYVLYDPTYSLNGTCFPDLTRAHIYRDGAGRFRQPLYSPLIDFVDQPGLVRHLIEERAYNTVHLVARLYKILCGREPPSEWCTVEQIASHLRYFGLVYRIPEGEIVPRLRHMLGAIMRDHGFVAGRRLTDPEIDALLEGPRGELSAFLKHVL